jgi:hypothetical protein
MVMNGEPINLTIGRSEALVLFELLADFHNQNAIETKGPAERLALARLHGALEKTLVEPFQSNYQEVIDQARAHLVDQAGSA